MKNTRMHRGKAAYVHAYIHMYVGLSRAKYIAKH